MPRWLVLLLTGILLGAGGVIFLQERYLPPRLTPAASAELRSAFEEADAERTRLNAASGDAATKLAVAVADKNKSAEELAASKATIEGLRNDLNSIVSSLPPDPRGGTVAIRSGWLVNKAGKINYDLVLTHERPPGTSIPATMQFSIAGESAGGTARTFVSQPILISVGSPQVLRGNFALPEGFAPRETTVQIAERGVGGRQLGMRVFLVR